MANVTHLLTPKQCEQFHRDGFLMVKNILPQADMHSLVVLTFVLLIGLDLAKFLPQPET